MPGNEYFTTETESFIERNKGKEWFQNNQMNYKKQPEVKNQLVPGLLGPGKS